MVPNCIKYATISRQEGRIFQCGAAKAQSGLQIFSCILLCLYLVLNPQRGDKSDLPQHTLRYVRTFFSLSYYHWSDRCPFAVVSFACPVSFIVAGPNPIEKVESRGGKYEKMAKSGHTSPVKGRSVLKPRGVLSSKKAVRTLDACPKS